jgi:hypothetical protein
MASHGLFGDDCSGTAGGVSSATAQGGKGQALFKEEAARPQRESPSKKDEDKNVSGAAVGEVAGWQC